MSSFLRDSRSFIKILNNAEDDGAAYFILNVIRFNGGISLGFLEYYGASCWFEILFIVKGSHFIYLFLLHFGGFMQPEVILNLFILNPFLTSFEMITFSHWKYCIIEFLIINIRGIAETKHVLFVVDDSLNTP